ncbi:MAG: GNAT family N-acetyltransferase [Bacteroidia bacterium]|nr:GNAT family N-acetyltransferase [Bacteroidia bacterium]
MELMARGIRLKRLEFGDIELVRFWRNLPHVRDEMEFREIISPEAQKIWFSRLDQERNYYFLFGEKGRAFVGLVHIKEIDPEQKTGEAGIFTGNSKYLNGPLPVKAVLLLMEFAFSELGLESLTAKMRGDRQGILQFNQKLGYEPVSDQQKGNFVRMEVTRERFFDVAKDLRRALL